MAAASQANPSLAGLGRRGPSQSSRLTALWQTLVVLAALGGLATLAAFPMEWSDQAILGGAMCVLAWFVNRLFQSRTATLTLVGVSLFTTVRYLWWRFSETYSYLSYNWGREGWGDLVFVFVLLGAESYAFVILTLGYLQSAQPLDRKPEPLPDDPDRWPTVDIFIPTYNEPLAVLKPTVLAAKHVDWPRDKVRVWVLDDGCRDEIRDFAARCGVEYVGRADSRFAKAGNLNNTMRNSDGELIAIFDCDHVPTRSFLQVTVGAFVRDPKLSMLQTPHHFYTPDPIERNLGVFREIPNEGALFYGVVQKGNDFWNATSFAGSCAVLRRSALEEIGGIAVETVTEDAHTSLRLQKAGWNTAYLDIPQAAGLATFTLRDHVNQRIRWARGLTQILRIEKPLRSRDLKWPQRLCYFNSSVHFLYALPRLIFLTAPLGFLILELSNFYGYVLAILAYALPHLFLANVANARLQGRFRNPFWNEIFETALAPFILIPTTLALISPRKGLFNVTPKSVSRTARRYDWLMAAPFLALAGLNLAGIGLGVQRLMSGDGEVGTLAINIAWALYSSMILGVALAVAEEPGEVRGESRIPVQAAAFLVLPDGRRVEASTEDISYGGVRLETPDAVAIKLHDQITVGFDVFGKEARIAGRVVWKAKWTVQVRFANLTLPQEEALTRLIFSRADAWVSWNDSYPERYGAFRSMGRILGLSLVGYGRAIRALFRMTPGSRPDALTEAGAASRQAATPLLAWIALGGLLAAAPLSAQPATEPAAAPAPFSETHLLSDFGLRQPIVLQGLEAREGFRFWSPLTKVVNQASLELHYQASTALAASESTLLVLLNDEEVAAAPLNAAEAGGFPRIELPADLLVGENELSFAIDARCEPSCGDGSEAGAVWVRVERTSLLRLEGERLPVALELRLLPMPFLDLSLHRAPLIGIVTSADADSGAHEAVGIAASWLGVLSDHRGVRFHALVDEIPQGHAIVAARSDSALAARLGLSGQSRPTIALLDNPADPYGAVLALVGPNGASLRTAAQALALGLYSGAGAMAEIGDIKLPPTPRADQAPRWLDPGQPILFSSFAEDSELRVVGDSALELYVRTPPDLNYGSTRRLPLRLRYVVRDLGEGSRATLTLMMNGVFLGKRDLEGGDDIGEGLREDLFPVPVEAMYPSSTLQVSFSVTRRAPEGRTAAYPALEIAGESELDMTASRRFAALPRLDLLAHAGYPFTRHADLSETAVVLAEKPGPAALSMFYNLMGFFGSNTGLSAYRVTVSANAPAPADKHLLVLGSQGDAVFAPWASRLAGAFEQPRLVLREDAGKGEWTRRLSWGGFGRQRQDLVRALQSNPSIEAALEGARLDDGDRALVAIAVAGPEAGSALVDAIQGAGDAGELYGAFSFLSKGRLRSFVTAPPAFYVGEPSLMANLDFWLRRYLWALPLLVLGFAYLVALVARSRLRRAAELRLETAR